MKIKNKKTVLTLTLALTFLLLFSLLLFSCGENEDTSTTGSNDSSAKLEKLTERKIMIKIEMKDGGTIECELYPDLAPISVENFTKLIKEGFYDGLIFHRVIPDFMIQGGDPEGTGMGGSDKTIKGEFSSNGVDNPLSHTKGVLSMARSNDPNSASSQFFICVADSPHLDGQYAAFGKVVKGMDVADKIALVETDQSDKPLKDIVIKKITIEE